MKPKLESLSGVGQGDQVMDGVLYNYKLKRIDTGHSLEKQRSKDRFWILCEGACGHVALWNFRLRFEPSGLRPLNMCIVLSLCLHFWLQQEDSIGDVSYQSRGIANIIFLTVSSSYKNLVRVSFILILHCLCTKASKLNHRESPA
jgi:hypothetical protein